MPVSFDTLYNAGGQQVFCRGTIKDPFFRIGEICQLESPRPPPALRARRQNRNLVNVLVKDLRFRRILPSDNPNDVPFPDRLRNDGLTDPSPTLLGEEKSHSPIFDLWEVHRHTAQASFPGTAKRAMRDWDQLLTLDVV
jgi:hypothetical protein